MATVPTPFDWTAGVAPTASQLDAGVRDVGTFTMAAPSCSLYQSAGLSCTNATWTRVLWDSEHYDNDSMHSTSTNTGKLTFTTAGQYLINLSAWWTLSGTGIRGINLTKNNLGSRNSSNVVLTDGMTNGTVTAETLHSATVIRRFAAGDYIEQWVYQSSGGALSLSGGYNKTLLQAQWLST